MSGAEDPIEPSSGKSKQGEGAPVWHRPAWITAIVGLVSAFLTIPDVIGNYLAKEQDIEIAKQQVIAAELSNIQSKQEQELDIIRNSLTQQGEERIFMLRYFAATLDDEDAKSWAEREVRRFDELVAARKELESQRIALAAKEEEVARLTEEGARSAELEGQVDSLRAELDRRNLTYQSLRSEAGIVQQAPVDDKMAALPSGLSTRLDFLLTPGAINPLRRPDPISYVVYAQDGRRPGRCRTAPLPLPCSVTVDGPLPERVVLRGDDGLKARVQAITTDRVGGATVSVRYRCTPAGAAQQTCVPVIGNDAQSAGDAAQGAASGTPPGSD